MKNDSIRLPTETTVSPLVALGSAAAGPPCQMRSKLGAPIAIRLPTTQNGPVSAGNDQVPIVADIVAVITVQAIAPAIATSQEEKCSPRKVTAAMPIRAPQ